MQMQLTKNTSDTLKLVAALIIAVFHFSQEVHANKMTDCFLYYVHLDFLSYMAVGLFFFLSGYGLMESERKSHLSFRAFVKNRFFKLFYPIALVTVIWLVASSFLMETSPFLMSNKFYEGMPCVHIGDVMIDFGDDVLWFVKVLAVQYLMFFVFSAIDRYNSRLGTVFVLVATISITAGVYHFFAPYYCISVPMFGVGVLLSKYRHDAKLFFLSLLCSGLLLTAGAFIFLSRNLLHFVLIYEIILPAVLLPCFVKSYDIKLPAIAAGLSLDVYIIHYKVLMALMENMAHMKLWLFVSLTVVLSIGFNLLRNYLRPKLKMPAVTAKAMAR